ncbi:MULTISPECIES: TIGR02536 family ethanolamine utilization protein [unclassified Clostridioides]|uniref:TIGR02536 family ethanolamine utilization protein n=1 Tax=unclassified Clostridioides TaxID=2635829 RepID=UPI001D10DEFF|nr:TIGR02536 family ethanolamine utilization protein [Clostridioides sp. ZZV14-6150]MCC0661218.1 TIGR02536 family ethanolamine utilization protein [Clostridioides sp. ZZV14-6154]MCC0669039.1 TIGR02536 family ethanolamine utilization protein [Clostridioides sp. ZZV14-6153]MCC0719519.1 TIGR02536 family ethanolamine utilization protein [Clostridioides sp. ZZV14-6105]MCC0723145.1 TIGR02536 family ethanolamine utilization protein [Clostridioides sp. ZZV14-6104]MCC0727242.1 TIGR02536 family ethanola
MDYNNLIEIIVEELYKKINITNIGCIENENRKKLVILYENDKSKFDLLSDKFNIEIFDNDTKDCDVVIVSKLCMRGICNLALGNSFSNEERFLLKMLMKGKKVYVLDGGIEYKLYKDTAPKTLYNKYRAYEDGICKYGVKIIKDLNEITLSEVAFNEIAFSEEKFKKEILNEEKVKIDDKFSIDLTHKRLISESDLRKPMINGTKDIIVSQNSIITPLAMDFIRIHNITVKRI